MRRPVLIIAEAGVNHNGSLPLAFRLVDEAAKAGADVVKFQTWTAEGLVSKCAGMADYQIRNTGVSQSQFEMLKELEMSTADQLKLIGYCREKGIEFLSSPFDIPSIDVIADIYGLNRIKIPSGELTNLPYLRHVGRRGIPLIISTGMASLGEIEAALQILDQAGTPRERVTVLHCNTEYPSPMADVNLRAMLTIRDAFGVDVGYSDHTQGIEVAIAAATLGATVVEKHFTLDRNLPGPDHKASLEPAELKSMITAIRNIEQALGDGIKRLSPSEARNRPVARKSVVAACAIRAGEVFNDTNIAVKRPGTGISPMRWDEVLGRRAPRDFYPDELIEL
jgi:N,N'-diacetyllegionaminate synthase